jgi:hypothetical protein
MAEIYSAALDPDLAFSDEALLFALQAIALQFLLRALRFGQLGRSQGIFGCDFFVTFIVSYDD